jgi:hypothetical protein
LHFVGCRQTTFLRHGGAAAGGGWAHISSRWGGDAGLFLPEGGEGLLNKNIIAGHEIAVSCFWQASHTCFVSKGGFAERFLSSML